MESTYPFAQLLKNVQPIPWVEWSVHEMLGSPDSVLLYIVAEAMDPETREHAKVQRRRAVPRYVRDPQEAFEILRAELLRLVEHEVNEWLRLRSDEFVRDPHPEAPLAELSEQVLLAARARLLGREPRATTRKVRASAIFPRAADLFHDGLPAPQPRSELLELAPAPDVKPCPVRPGETVADAVRRTLR